MVCEAVIQFIKSAVRCLLWKAVRIRKPTVNKLNLGCGNVALEGYINIDVVPSKATDFVMDISDLSFLECNTYEEIRLDAAFEHLWRWQQRPFLCWCYRALKLEGILVINWLPDFERIVEAWQHKECGLKGPEFNLYEVYRFTHGDPQSFNAFTQIHKDIFTRESIRHLLEDVGFQTIEIQNVCYGTEHIPLNMRVRAWKHQTKTSG